MNFDEKRKLLGWAAACPHYGDIKGDVCKSEMGKHTPDYHQALLNCKPAHLTCRVNPLFAATPNKEAVDSDHEINAHR